jgi:hypothetical protein
VLPITASTVIGLSRFSTKESLDEHADSKHGRSTNNILVCPVCLKEIPNRVAFYHLNLKHSMKPNKPRKFKVLCEGKSSPTPINIELVENEVPNLVNLAEATPSRVNYHRIHHQDIQKGAAPSHPPSLKLINQRKHQQTLY